MIFRNLLIGIILSFTVVAASVHAQPTETKLTASDGDEGDLFGSNVSLDGDRILVGAHSDDQLGEDAGAAYVYRYDSTWIEEAKLTASSGAESDLFGWKSVIDGDFAIVGAPFEDHSGQKEDAGAAYIFHFDGASWVQQARLTASDAEEDDQYGWTVSIEDRTAIVGSTWDNNYTGGVYVYRFTGSSWFEEIKITASDSYEGQRFGESIQIFDGRIIVGARFDDDLGAGAGAAYIYKHDGTTWIEEAKLTASDGAPVSNFGDAVALGEDVAIVGASRRNTSVGLQTGGAYIFRYDNGVWTEEAILMADDASSASNFGNSVGIDGNRAVIGAYNDDEIATNAGAAYVFHYDATAWSQETKIYPDELALGDAFGNSVAIKGDTVLAGSPHVDRDTTSNVGATYVYELQPFNPVSVEGARISSQTALHAAYPNPFSGQTTVQVEMKERGRILLDIYDVMGRKIAKLADETVGPGSVDFTWDGRFTSGTRVPQGTYFFRLDIDGLTDFRVETETVVIVR